MDVALLAALAEVETTAWVAASQLEPDEEVEPGLTAAEVVAFHERPVTPAGAQYHRRVVYGTAGLNGRDLTLYLYARRDTSERRPAVVFIHGGGWEGGHPFMHIRHAHYLASLGYVTATITYRRYPEVRVDECVADAKCAVRWLREGASRLGADPDRIGVAGCSAGGHLAAMVALTPGRFEGHGGHADTTSSVQAAVLLYPITDMRVPGATHPGFAAHTRQVVGSTDEKALLKASPISYASAGAPPVLTITGADDTLCPLPMLQRFHCALDAHGVVNDLIVFRDRWHAFDFSPREWPAVTQQMVRFFDDHLRSLRTTGERGQAIVP